MKKQTMSSMDGQGRASVALFGGTALPRWIGLLPAVAVALIVLTTVMAAGSSPGGAAGQGAARASARPGAKAAPSKVQDYLDFPVTVQAPVQPLPVRAEDGKWYLIYELHLTNWSVTDLVLKKLEILDGRQGGSLASYEGGALIEDLRMQTLPPAANAPAAAAAAADARRIGSGRTAVLFITLALDALEKVPTSVRHRAQFERNPAIRLRRDSTTDELGDLQLDTAPLPVRNDKPSVLRSPVRGGPWQVEGSLAKGSRYALVVREGRARIPERFGCTFSLADDKGNLLPESPPPDLTNAMFYGYGAEVLAVAEAVVSFVKDSIPDTTPSLGPPAKPLKTSRETMSGNWIGLDLGNNRFAFYAHLKPGSIRVKTGDKVRAGQVIALVGNSGDSRIPHLSFHMGDANAVLGSEGLPFVLDAFEVVEAGSRAAPDASSPPTQGPHKMEIPLRALSMRTP